MHIDRLSQGLDHLTVSETISLNYQIIVFLQELPLPLV